MSIQGKDIVKLYKGFPVPAICCSIVFVGLVSLYFRAGNLDEATAKLEERSKELKRLKANISASSQLDAQLGVLEKANTQFQKTAMHVTELAKNPQVFYNLEKETGVTLVDVKQLVTVAPAKSPVDGYIIIPFSVTAEGEFKQLIGFMKLLEYGQNLSSITNASLSPGQGARLSLSFNIDVLGLR